jgi:hypothetical protein
MSFDLFVYVPTLPSDLIPLWEAQLAHHGLICSFYPGLHPVAWPDNFIPVQVGVVPAAFPLADRYGSAPLAADLELYYEDSTGEDFPEWRTSAFQYAPPAIHPYLEQASCCLYFRTAAGRTLIEFRLQYFAAATLAVLTSGVVDEPQAGQYLVGANAIKQAALEADTYEARADPEEWRLPLFNGWPDVPNNDE